MKFSFQKYHGAGNDFIMVNCLTNNIILNQEQISFLCSRHLGIGADGLIKLLPSETHDFSMIYYNADGNEGSMCGNGGRSVAAFAFREGITGKKMKFTAYDGEHEAVILQSSDDCFEVKLSMKDVQVENPDNSFLIVDTGSPHYVGRVDNLADYDVNQFGRSIRFDTILAPEGVNVNFMEKIESQIFLRTYERGVENETLSCGTGVTAAAIAASLWFGGNSHDIITSGGDLHVDFDRTENCFSNIVLIGPVKFVYEGNISI
ncbi:MAG: diaminopimelate epimerase [Bacteroidales bacterium]|nr:diaminopimelate epimerase [Bacteroidales bacterium]